MNKTCVSQDKNCIFNSNKYMYDIINDNGICLNKLFNKIPDKNLLSELNKYYQEFILNINKLFIDKEQTIEFLKTVNQSCKEMNFKLFRKSLIDNKVVEDFFSKKKQNEFYRLREYILKLEKENYLLESILNNTNVKRKRISYESSILENKKLKKNIQELKIEKEEMKKKIHILEKEKCNREYIDNSNIIKLLSPLE